MRVLVIHCRYRYKGGEDTVVAQELELMRNNGIETDLLLFDNDGNGALKLLLLPFNLASFVTVRKRIRAFRPDIVHLHNFHFAGSFAVIWAIRSAGIPFVTTLHNFRLVCPSATLFFDGKLFTASLRERFPWKAVRRGVYKQSMLLTFWLALSTRLHHSLGTLNLTNRYIVLSHHAKKIFMLSHINLASSKLVVKHNFTSAPGTRDLPRSNFFLYAGRLTEEKGVKVLLEAFAASQLPLVLIGDGELRPAVERYAAEYPNIVYKGNMEKSEVPVFLSTCTALVFPSIWFEGMPMILIEAMAAGTPVIASGIGVMETMIEPGYNGLLFEAGNAAALVKRSIEWHDLSASDRQRYYENAQKAYEASYTPEKSIQKLKTLYSEVLNEVSARQLTPVLK